jgi:hypothetical protein
VIRLWGDWEAEEKGIKNYMGRGRIVFFAFVSCVCGPLRPEGMIWLKRNELARHKFVKTTRPKQPGTRSWGTEHSRTSSQEGAPLFSNTLSRASHKQHLRSYPKWPCPKYYLGKMKS